jgi:hypothetical protein
MQTIDKLIWFVSRRKVEALAVHHKMSCFLSVSGCRGGVRDFEFCE